MRKDVQTKRSLFMVYIPTVGGGFWDILPPSPFQECPCGSPIMMDHLPSRKTGRAGDSKSDSVCLVELDGILCCHGTPGCSSPRADIVQNWGPFHALEGRTRGDPSLSRSGRTNGAEGGHDRGPHIGCLLAETGNQDGGLAHFVSVQDEWDRTWGSIVARCPLSTLHNRSSRPPI